MDKVKFRNEKAKPYAEKAILKMLDKAFPCDDSDDEEEDEVSKKRPATEAEAKKSSKKPESEPEDDDYDSDEDWGDEEDDATTVDYSKMSAQELYKLCKERDIIS